MAQSTQPRRLLIETSGESDGICECCGNESRCVWGMVYEGQTALAAYWMQWTVGHLGDAGANLDLIVGRWGEGANSDDRVAVSLLHRQQPDGSPGLMIVDAAQRPAAKGGLAGTVLTRAEVIGTPLATQVFEIADAIYQQDGRLAPAIRPEVR